MKKILFPTDFSPASNNAFVYALQLARHTGAEIVTVHVYEMPIVDYVDVPTYQIEVYDTVELANFENYKGQIPMLRRIAEENGCTDVPVSNVLMDGDLVSTVLKMIKEDNIDYVVMGTKGASGVKETFLGTSTANVMTRTDAIVLAIPEAATYSPVRKIAFTTQFLEQDFAALKKVLSLAVSFQSKVELLFVKTPSSSVNEVIIADWKLQLKNEPVNFHTVENSDVESAILDFLDTHKIDILALSSHKRGFFEGLFHVSLTKKLAFHSRIPVFGTT